MDDESGESMEEESAARRPAACRITASQHGAQQQMRAVSR